jgi:hypothetical protein
MNNLMKQLLLSFISLNLFFSPTIAMAKKNKKSSQYNLQKLVLPSEVNGISKSSGSIYYSPSVKGKVLIPVHIWGEISNSGLHFLPIDTSLISGLSLAGGPSGTAKLEEVKLTRKNINGKYEDHVFDISSGGKEDAYKYKLKPDDTIYLKKDRFYDNRSYYTGLTGVIVTVLSSILLFKEVQKSN